MSYSVNPLKQITVFESKARTASANSTDLNNFGYRGVTLTLKAASKTGTSPTLDVKVQGKDAITGEYYDLHGAAFAQVTDNQANVVYLTIYPGVAETSGQTVSDVLPKTWRVVSTIGGTNTPGYTFGVSATLLP